MHYRGYSITIIERGTKHDEYWRCQVAVNGIPCIPFDVHDADFRAFSSSEQRNAFLARQGISMVEEYGDARFQKPKSELVGTAA